MKTFEKKELAKEILKHLATIAPELKLSDKSYVLSTAYSMVRKEIKINEK